MATTRDGAWASVTIEFLLDTDIKTVDFRLQTLRGCTLQLVTKAGVVRCIRYDAVETREVEDTYDDTTAGVLFTPLDEHAEPNGEQEFIPFSDIEVLGVY